MPPQTYTHDPSRHIVALGGHNAQGFADGSMVAIALNTDQVTLKVGVLGDASRAVSRDRSGKITLTLFPGSPTNDFLSALADQDYKTGGGTTSFYLKDLNGRTFAHCDKVWVTKKPDMDLQKESTDRVWVLEGGNIEYYIGGEVIA